MSLLPQRKKSPGEIAKLRENLGVPGTPAEPANHQPIMAPQAETRQPAPPSGTPAEGPKAVHSLKRSERMAASQGAAAAEALPKPDTAPVHPPRSVRSLRKSERLPATPHPESPPDSNLPHQRHSDEEIARIRRREVLALMEAKPNPRLFPAHPALIIPGYLSGIAGAVGFHFYQIPILATVACVIAAVVIAVLIGIRKPISRHHAAFIAVIALFVIVFGALHYFPHLRHAT